MNRVYNEREKPEETQATVKSSLISFEVFHCCKDSHRVNHMSWAEEKMSSKKDDNNPRVSCLLLVILLTAEENAVGTIPFNRSMKHKLLLKELQYHIED